MKKILIIGLIISGFFIMNYVSAACSFDGDLESCIKGTKLVQIDNAKIEDNDGFKGIIQGWTNNIALFLGLISIGAVIYGGLMMTLSTGEDEKIKKAKDIVKWSLLGLLGVILATTIVTLIINLIYGISSKI